MAKQVFIDIPKGGEGEIRTSMEGFEGQSCKSVSDIIVANFGGQVTHSEDTSGGRAEAKAVQTAG